MEDWESVLAESAAAVSPIQEQSILRWIMGDVEDPALGNLNKLGVGSEFPAAEFDVSCGYGGLNQSFAGDHLGSVPVFLNNNRSISEKIAFSPISVPSNPPSNFKLSSSSHGFLLPPPLPNNPGIISFHHHQTPFDSSSEARPPSSSSPLLFAQQPPNPPFFFPVPYSQQPEQTHFLPPPAKRQNSGGLADVALHSAPQISKGSSQEPYIRRPPFIPPPQLNQQATAELLYKAAELLQTGNPILAQGILARLNHQLSPIGMPFRRAAFYFKEALQLLLHCTTTNTSTPSSSSSSSPFSLIFRIAAYKSFSEISPTVQFANFTSNQAILEALEGFNSIHIVDFDIGYGGQWASLLQELALRTGGPPSLKLTAVISPAAHDHLELSLAKENLIQFASEINLSLEFEAMAIDSLTSGSWNAVAVAVNLPVGSPSNSQFSMPLILRFLKQISPKIVVSVDRFCHRTDLSFSNHVIHAFQSCTSLLDSVDAVNAPVDTVQKIERLLIHPGIERIVVGRFRSQEKTQHWRSMFLAAGFSPATVSGFTESQAECIVKRAPVRGFRLEKRQSSLVLCWQGKELVSSSAWRC